MDPICYACGGPIRLADNKATDHGVTYHMECWDREQAKRRAEATA